jgi:hypothetical protein
MEYILLLFYVDAINFLLLTMGGVQVRARYASVAAKLLSSVFNSPFACGQFSGDREGRC